MKQHDGEYQNEFGGSDLQNFRAAVQQFIRADTTQAGSLSKLWDEAIQTQLVFDSLQHAAQRFVYLQKRRQLYRARYDLLMQRYALRNELITVLCSAPGQPNGSPEHMAFLNLYNAARACLHYEPEQRPTMSKLFHDYFSRDARAVVSAVWPSAPKILPVRVATQSPTYVNLNQGLDNSYDIRK